MSRVLTKVVSAVPALLASSVLMALAVPAAAADLPVTGGQRELAERVAQAGVPVSELAPNAPDAYTIKPGDTLWGISTLFLKSPWRWPELWGMNMAQVRNPHLIYPGQVLLLLRDGDRARLQVGRALGAGTEGTLRNSRLLPSVRDEMLPPSAIAAVPMHLIGPFLNEAVVFETNALANAPRIVSTQEGRVLLSRGEKAFVRGDVSAHQQWRIFREAKPLVDPESRQVLGFEARYVGSATVQALGDESDPKRVKPSVLNITSLREEAGVGDRLAPMGSQDETSIAPHAPAQPIGGHLISVYGDGLNAGQNQVVALNRGRADGLERGHVLALWRAGAQRPDPTSPGTLLVMPDERHGSLFVFRVFERVSYALILQVREPVAAGDRFSQP
jgi:hypothetical protein